jgi:tetratricopeptide (TPR) repeat protein
MGEVFRAFDPRLNRVVAVKVMRRGGQEHAEALHRFLREARAASALNHPNIVTIHEIGETPLGEHFIVQEFIEGTTLRSLLDRKLPFARIVEIGREVARALAAAHAAGIVHRDVKPENVMVRGDGYVKVLDFGVARVFAHDPDGLTTYTEHGTAPGTLVGTTSYMSPEQASGVSVGPASDIFSLGVMLYEMAAGRRPFVAPTSIGVLAAILSEQPVPLTRLDPAIPFPFDAIVQRMLMKEPSMRPAAREIDEELAALLGRESASAAAASTALRRRTVGRETEREEMRRAYGRVKSGRGLMLGVSGEPGIGKTSLVEDFLSELATGPERPIVTRGRCSERLAGAEAYLPILEALDTLLHRGSTETVNTVMKAVAPTWYVQVAAAAFHQMSIEAVRADAPAASQERMKRELAGFLQEISRSRPVIVYLDDLHWADVSTIDMLNYLAGRFDDLRVLVLVTYRPAEMALAQHPFVKISHDLRSRGSFEELPLRFLGRDDVERYLAQEFPSHRFPPSFSGMIYAKTEGSPLFMADLVRYLHDSGGIVQENGTWTVARSLPDSTGDLPESVRGMITRKIDQLSDGDRRLLAAASVQGQVFDSVTLGEATELDAADVEDRLDVLQRVHVFVRKREEHEFPDLTLTQLYEFVHVLYQNVLYTSLSPTRRTTLSGKFAKSLVSHHGAQTSAIAGQLALLFEGARDFVSSAQYFYAAAQHSTGLFGFREAISLADRGLRALRTVPDGPARKQLELGLQMTKGVALRSTIGWAAPDIEQVFARARQLCLEMEDPPELFPVLWALTLFHLIRGNLKECRDRADELVVKAEAAGGVMLKVGAYHLAGVCREFIGEMVESSRLLEHCRELHVASESPKYAAMYGLDPGIVGRAMSSRPLWALGYPDRALERARETLGLARLQRQPIPTVFALVVIQGIHLYRGEASQALEIGDEILALCKEYELPQEAEWSRSFQGSALAALGRASEGAERLKESLAVQQSISAWLVRPPFLGLLADALRQEGRIDEGLAAIDEGFADAGRRMEHGYLAELHRIRGGLLRLAGNEAAAEESLRAAVEYARVQQTRSLELRAASGLARLLAASGRTPEARAVLAPVYEWFTEGHDTADLRSARTILSEIG